jgi:succinate dehydrogenase (ubiquinone) membrane anchor subunit
VLGAAVVTYMGLMKLNLAGPGLTQTVKSLWRK